MVRRAQTPPVTAKLYRHFAVVTLVATLGLAMLADGENREAVAREVERAGRQHRQTNPNDFIRKDAKQQGSFGTDAWVDGGMGPPAGGIGSSSITDPLPIATAPAASGMPAGYTSYGMTAEAWAKLSDEQKKAIMERQRLAAAAAAHPDRAEQIGALLAASQARAGKAEPAL